MSPYLFSPAIKIEVYVDTKSIQFDGVTRLDAGENLHVWIAGILVGMIQNYSYWRVI